MPHLRTQSDSFSDKDWGRRDNLQQQQLCSEIHLQRRYRNYTLQHGKRHPSHLQSTQPTGTLQRTQRGNEDEQCAKRFPTPRMHWDFMLECSKNVKDGKCENVLYMQKDRFSSAQQGFQNAFKRTKTAKKEMQRKTTNRIRSRYREAQIKYHARNQPQDYQQQSQQQWEILKTSSMSRMTPLS